MAESVRAGLQCTATARSQRGRHTGVVRRVVTVRGLPTALLRSARGCSIRPSTPIVGRVLFVFVSQIRPIYSPGLAAGPTAGPSMSPSGRGPSALRGPRNLNATRHELRGFSKRPGPCGSEASPRRGRRMHTYRTSALLCTSPAAGSGRDRQQGMRYCAAGPLAGPMPPRLLFVRRLCFRSLLWRGAGRAASDCPLPGRWPDLF